ncbi:hypothetical protein KKG71_00095 [Patescibacteria group bacterium]|nr:hypothetical protein [Patescibacteria group bacterium]
MTQPHFPGQKEGERIQLIIRKHWIIYLFFSFKFILTLIAPIGIMSALTIYKIIPAGYLSISWSFFLLYLLYGYLIVFIQWLNEELDTVIITNERIINVDQISFMHRQIAETSLAHLSDVRGQQKGIWADLLNYGMVEMQSGADQTISKIFYVPKPFKVAEKVLGLRNDFFIKHSSVDSLKDNSEAGQANAGHVFDQSPKNTHTEDHSEQRENKQQWRHDAPKDNTLPNQSSDNFHSQ